MQSDADVPIKGMSVVQPVWSGFFAGLWFVSILLLGFQVVFARGASDSSLLLPYSLSPVAFFLIASIPALFVRSLWRLAAATATLVLISLGLHLARSIWLQVEFEILDALANSLGAVGGAFVVLLVRRRSTRRPTAKVFIPCRPQLAKLSAEEAPLALHIAAGRSLAEYAVRNERPIADVREVAYAIHRKLGGRTTALPINVPPVEGVSAIGSQSPSVPDEPFLILGRFTGTPATPSSREAEAAE